MKLLNDGPLNDEEIRELDEFLLEAEGIEEAMDLSTLDGFLTAILCGPKTILPSEWLRWVWDMERGEDAPVFKDQAQAQRILGLLMRHMNDIAGTLHEAPEDYEPLLMENPNDGDPIPIIDDWCAGFMKGVHLDRDGWLPVLAGKPEWLSTILLYGTEEGWEALERKKAAVGSAQDPRGRFGRLGPHDSCTLARAAAQAIRHCHRARGRAMAAGSQSGQGRAQPAVPLRLGQEVQAVSRRR